ncbi:MAG: VCBS repeat-containing protein [Desulfobacterales bacterium]|nr:MAG: VCBS repeat-containing protein [Desulfobacterales bacterium]
MKQKKIYNSLHFFIIFIVFLFTTALANTPSKVLILPFNIHSDKDLSFLQQGIKDMLSTRLAYENKVVLFSNEDVLKIIEEIKDNISDQVALASGEKLGADYVIFGSLTVLGDSHSTDAQCMAVQQKKAMVTFNQTGSNLGDVISHIDGFAHQINETVFGRAPAVTKPSQPVAAKQPSESYRQHPDTLLEKEIGGYSQTPYEGQAPADKVSYFAWKSRSFKTRIAGIAVGDVDGDGNNETVFISKNTVHIYRYVNKKFLKIGEIEGKGDIPYIGVDVADINRNGNAEIFVTQLVRVSNQLNSFVLEWDGTNFTKIIDQSNWFYRVIDVPLRGGKLLLGQKHRRDNIFSNAGVFEMAYKNGQYEPIQRQALPKNINIYDFTYGDVLNDRREMIVAFSPSDYVRILESNGNEEWKSVDKYGGSRTYFDKAFKGSPSTEEQERIYMKQRIHLVDIDNDGKTEMVVVKNKDATGRTFSRVRLYNSGNIECLVWDVIAMRLKWRTHTISGYISDYVVEDLNNDGKKELVFSAASGGGFIPGKEKSYIATWEVKTKQE